MKDEEDKPAKAFWMGVATIIGLLIWFSALSHGCH